MCIIRFKFFFFFYGFDKIFFLNVNVNCCHNKIVYIIELLYFSFNEFLGCTSFGVEHICSKKRVSFIYE